MDLETFIGLDFYGKIANKADSGGKFSHPLGIQGCVLKQELFGMTIILHDTY